MEPGSKGQGKAWLKALRHAAQLTGDLVGLTGALGAAGYFGFRELQWASEWGALLGGAAGFSFAIYRVYLRVNSETTEDSPPSEGRGDRD